MRLPFSRRDPGGSTREIPIQRTGDSLPHRRVTSNAVVPPDDPPPFDSRIHVIKVVGGLTPRGSDFQDESNRPGPAVGTRTLGSSRVGSRGGGDVPENGSSRNDLYGPDRSLPRYPRWIGDPSSSRLAMSRRIRQGRTVAAFATNLERVSRIPRLVPSVPESGRYPPIRQPAFEPSVVDSFLFGRT